jgi:putative nucleotidyltransferase with HDIG domain
MRERTSMSLKNKIFSRLNSLDAIGSPPPVLTEVISMLDKEDSSAKKLSDIILKDPNLTARILRVANSSFYGCRQKVTTINQAVMILGLNAVKCLVLSMSVYNQVSTQNAGNEDEYVKLWQHFLETATAAQNIAERVKYPIPEEAYIAGLLHDFGLLFLQRYFPAEIAQVRKLMIDGLNVVDAEKKIFESDHQEVGSLIATKWNLPEKFSESMTHHHPESASDIAALPLLSKITILADNLSPTKFETADNLDQASKKLEILEACCDCLGIGMDDIKKIYNVLPKQVLYHADGMSLNMGDAVQYLSRVNSELFDLYIELANTFKERQELSRKLLKEERLEGTLESLHIALATLSHYINNSTQSISGQGEVLKLLFDKGDKDQAFARIPAMTDAIKNSVKKISIVLEELSNITSFEKINYFKNSKAIDIEQSLKNRLDKQTAGLR